MLVRADGAASPSRARAGFVRPAGRHAALVLAVLAVAFVTDTVREPAFDLLFDGVVYNLVLVIAAVTCWQEGRRRPHARGWLAIAAGLVCVLAGDLYWTVEQVLGLEPAYPSWGDLGWLLFYLPASIGVIWVTADERGVSGRRAWLDGIVVGLGLASAAAAFAFVPMLEAMDGDLLGSVTTLAYPVGDLLLVAALAGALASGDARGGRAWVTLAAGLGIFALADALYAVQIALDTYVAGGILDGGWVIGAALIGIAPALRDGPRPATHRRSATVLLLPLGASALALGVLTASGHLAVNWAAVALAAATLAAGAVRVVAAFRDAAALHQSRREARTDELTGLANRRAFVEAGRALLDDGDGDAQLAVVLIDLDGFKEINDTLGHQVGDDLLRAVGPRVASVLRGDDRLARLGGDEFALLLPDTATAAALTVAGRVRESLQTPFDLDGIELRIDASIGVAAAPEHGTELSLLLQRADLAMYRAKTSRSGVEVHAATTDEAGREHLVLVTELKRGIAAGELVLHYQPKLSLGQRSVVGVEALVRWQHPEQGLLPPGAFLPLAETTGLMPELTRCVLHLAAKQCREWLDEGRELPVSVNLSAASFLDQGVADHLREVLDEHGVPPALFEIEITEDVLIGDPQRAAAMLGRIRDLGARVSVDDYGTGYCSLAYLRDLPIDALKLDRMFLRGLVGDAKGAAIVRSTVDLAHSLGLDMVAEGVEDEPTLQLLDTFGCDLAQGFHLSRPLPAEQLRDWLDTRAAAEVPVDAPAA